LILDDQYHGFSIGDYTFNSPEGIRLIDTKVGDKVKRGDIILSTPLRELDSLIPD